MAESDAATAAVGEKPVPPVVNGRPVEVAEGVFVVPDGRVPLVPNVGVILGDRFALVVDTAMGPRNGAVVRALAEEVAGDRRLLVTLTHFHPEHGYGAQAFPQATIVYNRGQLDEFREKAALYVDMFRGFGPEVAEQLEGVELVEPQVVYDGACDLELGGRRVQLRTWGRAHTRGDQVVFLPQERVLFTGDLVENRFFSIFPYFPPEDADVDGNAWIAVLEELERLEPEIVVPGHGEVGDAGLVTDARRYLTALRSDTRRLADEGTSVDDAVAALEPVFRERYPDWDASEWIAFGVRCFYAEHER
jgi:glyoxylase-like metal-dependent hydrolase (beta-lactamase superfamily II)